MKNKFTAIALAISLISSSAAIAQEANKKTDNFAQRKADVVANITKEKALLDQMISCVNGAASVGDIEKCREQKQQAMQAAKQERIASKKSELQSQIQKLDEESNKIAQKTTTKQ
jgi:ABC-type phosphate transport system auxiliary subunit